MSANILINAVVLFAGISILSWGTNGWTIWTLEDHRRYQLLEDQYQIPNISFLDQNGIQRNIDDFNEEILLVDFIFTRCLTQCISMGYTMKQLQTALKNSNLNYHFLSISFDHQYDQPDHMKHYLQRFAADTRYWSGLTATDPDQLERLLKELGVIVIPDKQFGFIHNSAIYVIQQNQIKAIFDYEDIADIYDHIALSI